MKKFLLLLLALITILPIKAQRHVDELRDDEFRIIIPRHDWTEYMGYKKNSNGELEVNVPPGSLLDIFPKTDVEGDHEFDKSLFIQSAVVDDKIYVGMGSWVITDYINQTSQGYIFEQGAQKMWYGGTNLTTFPFETLGDWYYMGPAIAADDAGNLWVATRRTDTPIDHPTLTYGWGHDIASVAYYTPQNSPSLNPNAIGQGVKLEYQKNGQTYNAKITTRTDFMSAYGDGVGAGKTGHLWFTPEKQCFVECIIMKEGAVTDKKIFMLPNGEFNSHRGYINQFAPNKVLYHTGGQNTIGKIYYGTLDGATVETSTKITWEDTGLNYCRNGATAFILHGHEVIAYSDIPEGNETYYKQHTNSTQSKEIITPKFAPKAYINGAIPAAYAYDLKVSPNGDNYTLSFKSNAPASSATIKVLNINTGVSNTYDVGAVVQGDNSKTIDGKALTQGEYTWSVSIANNANSEVKPYIEKGVNPDTETGNRGGVAIDLDTESPFYGHIYTTMAKGGGIQRYYPDLTANGAPIHTGYFAKSSNASSPYRIKTNSGKLYIADWSDQTTAGVHVYNPNDGSIKQMFQGTYTSGGQRKNSNGDIITGSTSGIAFYGEGADRKMYAFVEDLNPTNQLVRYDLGTSDSWSNAPTHFYSTVSGYLTRGNVEVISCDKGLWICQNTYNNLVHNTGTPVFLFMDFNGNILFNSTTILGTNNTEYAFESGIAINKDMTKLAVAGGGNSNYSNVKIYNVTWNGNTPSLTFAYEIPLGHSTTGNCGAVEQIVFDPADNLLLFSRQFGLMAYTLKNNARNTITEAPSSQKFTINNLPTGSSSSTVKIPGIKELGAKRITLYDWTTKTKIGSFTPYDNVADQSFLSHSINVEKVITGKELETDFFNYAPGEGGMKSIARAIVIDNPVKNLQVEHFCHKKSDEVSVDEGHRKVRLTWEAQTYDRDIFNNYEIRYRTTRSDGSTVVTDWTKVETVSIDYSDKKYDVNRSASFVYELTYGGANTPNDPSDDYDLMYEFSIIPVYTYDTNDRGEQNTEYTVEVKTPVIPSAAPRVPINATLSQITEAEDDITRYSFDLKLDVATNNNLEIPFLIGGGKASIDTYVVEIAGDNASAIATELDAREILFLDGNGNDITSSVTFNKYPNGTTISANNCDHYDISNYCIVVKAPTATSKAGTKMPTLVWKNANPKLTYQVKVYGICNYECNFVAATPEEATMTIPMPTWSLTTIDFHKLSGDYKSLTDNEDMPMGSFRRIDPVTDKLDENPSNPVTLSAANYFGTKDAMLTPIYVTDGVLGIYNSALNTYENNAWEIDYTLFVYDSKGKQIKRAEFESQNSTNYYAPCYSNTKSVRCDILGLEVPYTTGIGEDGRIRKIYDPAKAQYSTKLVVEFKRKEDGYSFTESNTANVSSRSVQLPQLGVEEKSGCSVNGALYRRADSHFYYNNASSEGYHNYYYDAAMLFDWDKLTDLNRYMGYFGKSSLVCYGHYENPEHNPNTWVQYHNGSILTDDEVNSLNTSNPALTNGTIGYNGSNNWSELAITKDQVPMLVHYVYGADEPLKSGQVSTVKFNVTLTAEYPVIVSGLSKYDAYPDEENYCDIYADEDPQNYIIVNANRYMDVLTVPTTLSNMTVANTNVTTGVEGILTEVCGGVKLYPNPVSSSFTLEAPMIIGEVKILTIDGQLVKVVKDINETKATINVDELPQGMYLVNTLGVVEIMIKH